MNLSAVVVAAGRSQRMGFDKLLTPLAGQPLLLHTLRRLQASPHVTEVVLVIRPEAEMQIKELVGSSLGQVPIRLVHGGMERQHSVMAGLRAVNPDSEYVMIQDAARPFITPELVELVFNAAQDTGAAVCGAPSSDTLKEVTLDGLVHQTLDRSKIWAVQTPQIFRKKLLVDAYAELENSNTIMTDDTAVVEKMGHPVRVVLHHGVNIKVTTKGDWKLASAYLTMGEPDNPIGLQLRKLIHDLNNHLTPMMGYTFLLDSELPVDSRGKQYLENLSKASEKCHQVNVQIQAIVRELFPKSESHS